MTFSLRDEGRVVFFCGAGVSRARAGLEDFNGLAVKVIKSLAGGDGTSPAERLLNEAREFEARTGIAGIVSADRVFGLLEREYRLKQIQNAVAEALKPGAEPTDLSAHRALIELARGPSGLVRLVTTNFDLLFGSCPAAWCTSRESWFGWTRAQLTTADNRAV